MAAIDRLNGLAGEVNLAIKAPVTVATTGPITLAGAQTIDGVTVGNLSERVLVKDQADPRQNGIYIASTGNWIYAQDAGGNTDWTPGTLVPVYQGTQFARSLWMLVATTYPVIMGTSSLSFTLMTASPTTS